MPVFAQDNEPETKTAELMEPEASPTTPEEAAEEEAAPPLTVDLLAYALDNIFLMICAVLVLFMQAGFAMVEAGFNSAKNVVNILFKNLIDLCLGALLFWLVGYSLMYPGGEKGGYYGFGGFGRPTTLDAETIPGPGVLHPQSDFLFQVAFAATAATIVSGAVAGRMKFVGYLIYTVVITSFIYPISGMWKWGYGFLDAEGFHDFAGSLIVHAVGGFAGLAGAILLGPRIGRYSEDGKSQPMPGHNLTIATLGVLILLIGWFGFNPGSKLAFTGAESTGNVMLIATNTLLAACAGGCISMILSWVLFSKPDLSMALNGVLAGLVGITANCDCVTNVEAMAIGAIAGVLVVLGIIALDKLKIDDPVGAFPVHGLCGIWGGVATGIFGEGKELGIQIKGSLIIAAWAFVTMFIVFSILKVGGLLRVSPEEEVKGLDITEHGMHAYDSGH
jgi:Amt family ammonium transporter